MLVLSLCKMMCKHLQHSILDIFVVQVIVLVLEFFQMQTQSAEYSLCLVCGYAIVLANACMTYQSI